MASSPVQTFEPLVHLVGMKKDQRGCGDTAADEDVPGRARSTPSLAAYPTCCVGSAEVSLLLLYYLYMYPGGSWYRC
jgi:hypothetical protein